MNRRVRAHSADRPALLGDRDHTRRVARRLGLAVFAAALTILSPLTYSLARADSGRVGQFGTIDMLLVGIAVVGAAAAAAIAAHMAVHLLGREARARRER